MTELGSFSDLANIKVGDVEAPKPLPTGTYQAMFTGPMKEHKARSGNLAMRFPIKLIAATEDVDQEALQAAGGLPEKEYTIDFWMSENSRFRFTEFGKGQGASDQLNLVELAQWLVTEGNKPFLITCKHEADQQDASKMYMRLDNPTPISEG